MPQIKIKVIIKTAICLFSFYLELGPINTRTCYCPFPLIIMSRVLVMLTSLRNLYFAKLHPYQTSIKHIYF